MLHSAASTRSARGLVPAASAPVCPSRFRPSNNCRCKTAVAAVHEGRDHGRESVKAQSLRVGEALETAQERRWKETMEVETKVHHIESLQEWQAELRAAKSDLVAIEIQSEYVCQAPGDEFDQYHWKLDELEAEKHRMGRCAGIKHTFMRVARECSSVHFVMHEVGHEPTEESNALCEHLGVDLLPTVQFWKDGVKVFEHRGAEQLDGKLGEGVLYYGDTAAEGVKATDYVQELRSREDLEAFMKCTESDKELKVVNISLLQAKPCVHVFPAVLALARNFVGYAKFSRMHVDDHPQIMKDFNIIEVPTFLFFRNGEEVGRHVGSDRGDLIGQILSVQSKAGVAPPPPASARGTTPRPRRAVH